MKLLDCPLPPSVLDLPSPSLILLWERVVENVRRMKVMQPNVQRLRPHHKTHKLAPIVAYFAEQGITKAKCATIAEAEMAAGAGATDILVAYPLVGPAIRRFIELQRLFPLVKFTALADDAATLQQLSDMAVTEAVTLSVMIDLDVGQHRTGIAPEAAEALYERLCTLPGLVPAGLQAYDGHLAQSDPTERQRECEAAYAPVTKLVERLKQKGLTVPAIVAGGTPTFPMHAARPEVECSPGTCTLWDAGYASKLPDLDFLPAAFILTRVISRPTERRICLDLGHKALGSEMPQPRAIFPAIPEAQAVLHSEEHLVIETDRAAEFPVGTVLAAIPWHICPTVALHAQAYVVKEAGVEKWPIVARARELTV